MARPPSTTFNEPSPMLSKLSALPSVASSALGGTPGMFDEGSLHSQRPFSRRLGVLTTPSELLYRVGTYPVEISQYFSECGMTWKGAPDPSDDNEFTGSIYEISKTTQNVNEEFREQWARLFVTPPERGSSTVRPLPSITKLPKPVTSNTVSDTGERRPPRRASDQPLFSMQNAAVPRRVSCKARVDSKLAALRKDPKLFKALEESIPRMQPYQPAVCPTPEELCFSRELRREEEYERRHQAKLRAEAALEHKTQVWVSKSVDNQRAARKAKRAADDATAVEKVQWMEMLAILRGVCVTSDVVLSSIRKRLHDKRRLRAALRIQWFYRRRQRRQFLRNMDRVSAAMEVMLRGWKLHKKRQATNIVLGFLRDSASFGKLRFTLKRYITAARIISRGVRRCARVLHARRLVVSMEWDRVDSERVEGLAQAKWAELMEVATKKGKRPKGLPPVTYAEVVASIPTVPLPLKSRILAQDIVHRLVYFGTELRSYNERANHPLRIKKLEDAEASQRSRHQGPPESFEFVMPREHSIGPRPIFFILPPPLHLRLMIRAGLQEAETVQKEATKDVNKRRRSSVTVAQTPALVAG